jgi:DNA-binding GntR family transcriptional regulator
MTIKGLNKLEPISKKDRLAAALKTAILSGEIEPGEPIVETRVAKQFGVGQPIVREALIELEHEGFVQKSPYRETRVTKLDQQDINNIYLLRSELESLALELAKANATPKDITALQELAENMRQGAESLHLAQFYEADLAFHRKLWELSGNKYLAEALERVVVPLFAFFIMRNTRHRESYIESAAMHKNIVDLLPTLSATKLRPLMRDSLIKFEEQIASLLSKTNKKPSTTQEAIGRS